MSKKEAKARTPLRFKLSDGRPLIQTMQAPVHGLAKRKGGAFDPVYLDAGGEVWMDASKGTMIGVVIADNGHSAECWVVRGVRGPDKK